MYSRYLEDKWERLGKLLEFHVYVIVGEIAIPIRLLRRTAPSVSGCMLMTPTEKYNIT